MVITKTMTDEQFFLDKLKHRDIRPTATRLLILREMMRGDEAVSLPDLERYLPTVDKSTISRTLSLFLLNRLVHVIDDGSGSLNTPSAPTTATVRWRTSTPISTAHRASARSV